MLWWMQVAAAAAECRGAATFAELSQALLDGEQAIRDSDLAALDAAEAESESLLRCLESPLGPADVASFMRLKGITLFVRKERELATSWFSAARTIEPSYSLPEALFPEQHPLRRAFEEAPAADASGTRVPRPKEGSIAVNGRPGQELPEAMPWVLQWWDAVGDVRVTTFGEGELDSIPYPLRYPRGRWQAIASGAFQVAPSDEPGDIRGGLLLTGVAELGGAVAADFGLRALFARVRLDEGAEARLVPGAHVGFRGWFEVAGQPSFVGAAVLATSHDDPVVAPGALAKAGFRLGGRREFAEIALEAGFSREPFVMLHAGFGIGR